MTHSYLYTNCPCCETSLKVRVTENGLLEAMANEPFYARFMESLKSLVP